MSKIHLGIAKSWSAMMNKNIENTAAAAKKIESILHSIPDEEVKVNIVTTKTTINKVNRQIIGSGGIITQLGSGGILSAASGFPKEFTTNGPQLFVVGDNPGGHEDVTVVPRNNPGPTVDRINRKYGYGEGEGGNIIINLANVTKIDGNDIINNRQFSKKVRMEVGKERDKFV